MSLIQSLMTELLSIGATAVVVYVVGRIGLKLGWLTE